MEARSLDTMLRDGPVNQDQIKRLTRAGMGPCQSRRCREQVGLLLAQAAATPSTESPCELRRDSPAAHERALADRRAGGHARRLGELFGIPTQFSPHWEAGMAIAEPTAQTRLILSDE